MPCAKDNASGQRGRPERPPAVRFSVAPMMDWTDRHCRVFHRALSRHALLYTEMVTADAVLNGDRDRLLGFDPVEHPVALQLGGSEPDKLFEAARIGAAFGYDEINLNVGCPSERVQSGAFGACLMREPDLVADCLAAMREGAGVVPVTIKHRLGVDDQVPGETLAPFIETVARSGVTTFIVHARNAWLKGLSPKENRDVPPLDYALVRRMKAAYSDLTFVLNGGLESLQQAEAEAGWTGALADGEAALDGVMLGRAAYHTPAILCDVDRRLFGEGGTGSPEQAVEALRRYIAAHLAQGRSLHAVTRHMLGLFHGRPGARNWRRILSENAVKPGAGLDVVDAALAAVRAGGGRTQAA